jgi:catechol 2,3-dioxygenase-like lactoylglutathione lyase family enzyme
MAKIKHIAIFSDDPEKLAKFYNEVFGLEIKGVRPGRAVWLSDGNLEVALINASSPEAKKAGKKGIDHFGFTLDPEEKRQVIGKLAQRGIEPYDPRGGRVGDNRPFVEVAASDIDGNRFDLSTGMREVKDDDVKANAEAEAKV